MWDSGDDGHGGHDGVQYDTEHAEGHLDQFRTDRREDDAAYRRLLSRARALGLPTWDPAEFDRIHA